MLSSDHRKTNALHSSTGILLGDTYHSPARHRHQGIVCVHHTPGIRHPDSPDQTDRQTGSLHILHHTNRNCLTENPLKFDGDFRNQYERVVGSKAVSNVNVFPLRHANLDCTR